MKKIIIVSFSITVILFSSCTSTQITSSWREPDKEVSMNKLNKVLVVALLRNETNRHTAEDEMVSFLRGKGVASYGYLDNEISTRNEDAIRDKIRGDDFDGAVTMRLVDVDKDIAYTPGNYQSYPSYYRSFSGYYFRSWSYYSTPARYTTTKTYTVETNVYSIKEDRIIWSGLTETTNPDGVDKMTREIVKVVYRQMVKEGFISE
jgi:hypothetical protein